MLLTDGKPNEMDDLRIYESSILSVANTEMIDLSPKLRMAWDEIKLDVLDFLLNRASGTDPKAGMRRSVGVSDVVVTPQMKRWHALHTLQIVYRDAFHNQLNDRYQAHFKEYRELTRQARMLTWQFGIGLVHVPLPVATLPDFSFVAGPLAAATYYVRVAWVTAGGQEGEACEITSFDTPPGGLLVVALANPPAQAAGFNVYIGETPDNLMRQNGTPVGLGESFMLPESGLTSGPEPGAGQSADVYLTNAPTLRRG